jgi:hypothetical protein
VPTMESGLEVNTEKSKCIFMSGVENVGQCHNTKIKYKLFENVAN